MTTYVPLTLNPSATVPFQTFFTLDGASVLARLWWNFAGQRWYMTLTDQSNTPLWTGALIGSPTGTDIFLAPDVFLTSTLLYRADTGQFEVTP